MELFEYMLLLLVAIFVSNIINRFLPSISVPITQILLGAGIALLPLHFHITLNPDLFFVLFIAPLVFDNSVHIDKDAFWKLKLPIISMAFGLLFVSTIIGGFLVNILIPTIPVAAGCALIASLGPTDDVAVFSLAKHTKLPNKLMNILMGESAFNDAAGIVSFQFAIAVIMTGVFSPVHAILDFVLISAGGIAVGLVFTVFKYILMRWIRSLGLENVTLHILVEILTPFLVYLAAEAIGCSGVFAAFTAGVMHSFAKYKLSPDSGKLKNASESVWDMLSFTLNGLVFLLMGTQVPGIIGTIATGNFSISTGRILAYVMFIMLFFLVTRFLWSLFIHKKTYAEEGIKTGKIKAGVIVSLSGARGAVTLASILSIPLLLDNGKLFPERDLLILISVGVILISLILSDFILPLLFSEGKSADAVKRSIEENEAYIEVLRGVATALQTLVTPENMPAVERVTQDYYRRISDCKSRRHLTQEEREQEHAVRLRTLEWEAENTQAMLEKGEIGEQIAAHYFNLLEGITLRENGKKRGIFKTYRLLFIHIRSFVRLDVPSENALKIRDSYHKLKCGNDRYVLDKLKALGGAEETPAVKKAISEYELSLSIDEALLGGVRPEGKRGRHGSREHMNEILAQAFQLERDGIHAMVERGRISRESAREMRSNLTLLELEVANE